MRLARVVPLVLALTLSPACSSDSEAPAASAPSPTAEGSTFASTADVIAAMGKAGFPCEDPETGVVEGTAEAQRCIVGGNEDALVLRFEDDGQKSAYLEGKDPLASVVVGGNWAVQTVLPETAEKVGAAIGGEVRLGETG